VYSVAGLYFCVIGSTLVLEMMGLKYVENFFQNLPGDSLVEVTDYVKSYIGR
jgi:hypothetical protein